MPLPLSPHINSIAFSQDGSYLYGTTSSATEGHQLYRGSLLTGAWEFITQIAGYGELALAGNGKLYAPLEGTQKLLEVTHNTTAQFTETTQQLPQGYAFTGAMPRQPHRVILDDAPPALFSRYAGRKNYELKDHFGNVRAVIFDKKHSQAGGGYKADLLSYSNYYPFGMQMPGRSYSSSSYRYGFNGKEKDQEGMGGGGSTYDYGFRIYNPGIAKFLSVDLLAVSYPMLTPYQFASNTPIYAVDLDGLEANPYTLHRASVAIRELEKRAEHDPEAAKELEYGRNLQRKLGVATTALFGAGLVAGAGYGTYIV